MTRLIEQRPTRSRRSTGRPRRRLHLAARLGGRGRPRQRRDLRRRQPAARATPSSPEAAIQSSTPPAPTGPPQIQRHRRPAAGPRGRQLRRADPGPRLRHLRQHRRGRGAIYAYRPGAATTADLCPAGLARVAGRGELALVGAGTVAERRCARRGSIGRLRNRGRRAGAHDSVVQKGAPCGLASTANSPRRSCRAKGSAPIAVTVCWDVSTTDGSAPPELKSCDRDQPPRALGHHRPADLPLRPDPARLQLARPGQLPLGPGRPGALRGRHRPQGPGALPDQGRLLVFNGRAPASPSSSARSTPPHPSPPPS